MIAKEVFRQFSNQGLKSLEIIRETAYSPHSSKFLKTWGITGASSLIGRSSTYIRQQETEKKIPLPEIVGNKRAYNLQHINKLRNHFKTRKSKQNSETSIICFSNFKGGAAKTTSSVNCAQYFTLQGYKVLFIDCDSQASATQIFGYIPDQDIKEEETLLPLLISKTNSIEKVIKKTYWDGLDLIPANLALYNAEFIIPTNIKNTANLNEDYKFYNILANGLNEIKNKYDIIIMDCPPSMGMISINAIYAANGIIIPTPSSMLDFTSTVQFFSMLDETFSKLPEKKLSFIKLMITKHDGRQSSNAILNIIRQLYGDYVMLNIMYSSEVIKKASANMQTIYEIDKYDGSKKTLERAMQYANQLHEELENEIQKSWGIEDTEDQRDG